MSLLVFKLVATPLVIGLAGWASRRWGTAAGGWMAGLPVTTGPISVFLFLEYGPEFARQAALGTLYAMPAIAATAAGYAFAVRRGWGWIASQALAQACYLAVAALLTPFNPGVVTVFVLGAVSLVCGIAISGADRGGVLPSLSSRTVLFLRMAVATSLVLTITALASTLGPTLSGLFGTLLIIAGVLAAAGHREHGGPGGMAVIRGMMAGQVAFLAFYAVVWGLLPAMGLVTYGIALCAAALAGMGIVHWQRRLRRA